MKFLEQVMPYLWILLATAAFALEASTMQLVSVWFIPSALVAMLLSLFDVALWIQILVFVVLSLLLLVFIRPILSKLLLKRPPEPTNADRVIGQKALVTVAITPDRLLGEVRVDGKLWSARSVDDTCIPEGVTVEIVSIDGVKLLCRKLQS